MKRSELKKTINEIRKQSRQLVRELDIVKGVYLGTGFTFTQCHVLFELAEHRTLGLTELSKILLIDKSNTSRTVKKLVSLGLISSKTCPEDTRQKLFRLTAKGKAALAKTINLADDQVESAMEFLSTEQEATVIEGLKLYGDALRKSRLQAQFQIRRIKKSDEPQMARVIREVMTEFGAVGDGYSINDPEVDSMYSNYRGKHSCYFVIVKNEKVVGGAGLAPLSEGDQDVCELRKMYFMPQARGCGLGSKLLELVLNEARKRGFKKCYIETLERMESAKALYERFGFKPLKKPMGNTGHDSCDAFSLLEL
jgi:putative acetyltransferase